MNSKRTDTDVVVVGGGLAGLAAAAYVAQAGHTVTVLEGRGHVGGQAITQQKQGFFFNQGPHALYLGGPAESVLAELGISMPGAQPPTKIKLAFNGELETGPTGPLSLLRTRALSPKDKIEIGRLLARIPKLDPASVAEITVDQWLDHSLDRLRPRQLASALIRLATYVNQPDQLSADVAVRQIQNGLSEGVRYLDRGWQGLVDQLGGTPGVRIECGARVTELPDAPAVIVATGGPATSAALLETPFQVGPAAAASCLDLGLNRRPDVDAILGGDVPYYFSNHSAVAELAPTGHFHAAVAQYLGMEDEPDPEALRQFAQLAGVNPPDIAVERNLHRMTTVTAIATAHLGGLAGRPDVTDTGQAGVFLAGDWVGPLGHLADAGLASARAAATAALSWLDQRTVLV